MRYIIALSILLLGITKPQFVRATSASFVPYFEHGERAGFKITDVPQGSLWQKLKFERGDVLQRWNDRSVNDPADAFEMLEKMKSGDRIQILRNGKKKSLPVDIDPRKLH